ncbi:MAG TPA: hypothetical protein VLM37_02275, partial [Fibrobacteraceae bacterium]|nr:hypothetical protein [Fibrobacteraceae bacterium]
MTGIKHGLCDPQHMPTLDISQADEHSRWQKNPTECDAQLNGFKLCLYALWVSHLEERKSLSCLCDATRGLILGLRLFMKKHRRCRCVFCAIPTKQHEYCLATGCGKGIVLSQREENPGSAGDTRGALVSESGANAAGDGDGSFKSSAKN